MEVVVIVAGVTKLQTSEALRVISGPNQDVESSTVEALLEDGLPLPIEAGKEMVGLEVSAEGK